MPSLSENFLVLNAQALANQKIIPLNIPLNLPSSYSNIIEACSQKGYYLQTPQGTLNSKIDSIREATNTIQRQKQSWNQSQHYTVLGLELGYHTLELLKDPKACVWVLESSLDNIISACIIQDFSPFIQNAQLSIFYTPHVEGLETLINQIPSILSNIFIHRGSYTQNPTLYSSIKTMIDSILDMKMININTIEYFQRLWLPNILRNTPYYTQYPGVDILKDFIMGNSSIIVGAGPSLEDNILLLKENKNKAIIIAVNTVTPRLLQENIIPDIVVAIDPQNILYYHFIPLLQLQTPPILIAEPSLSPTIIRNYKAPILFSGVPLFQNIFHPPLVNKHRLDVGGSVATVAYSLAVYCGAKNITLLGLDLAYSKNRMHLRGNEPDTQFLFHQSSRLNTWETFGVKKAKPPGKLILHKGFNNTDVQIDTKFKTYIDWLENRFSYYSQSFPTINATEGGVSFKNIPNKNFQSVLPSLTRINKTLLTLSKKNINKEALRSIAKKLNNTLQEIKNYQHSLTLISKNPTALSEDTIQKLMDNLIKSEWISIKTQKFFLEIEANPQKFLTAEEILNTELKEQAIKKITYTVLLEKTQENINVLEKLLPLLNPV